MITKKQIGNILSKLIKEETTSIPDKIKIANMILENWYQAKHEEGQQVIIIDDIE